MRSGRLAAKGGGLLRSLATRAAEQGRAGGWLPTARGGATQGVALQAPWRALSRQETAVGALRSGDSVFVSRVHDSAVLPRAVLGFRGISTRGPLLNEVAPASDGAEVVPKAKGDDAADAKPKLIPHKAQHHDFPRALARVRNVKTSMKKLNLVAQLVRRAHVDSALLQLALTNKKTAKYVRKLIHEAKFNAVAMGMDPEQLLIDEVRIGRSTYLKRIEFKGRGKTGIRRKPYCHINVFVREIQPSDEFAYAKLKRHRPRWKRLINEAKERLRQTYTDAPPRSQIRRRSVLLRRSEE